MNFNFFLKTIVAILAVALISCSQNTQKKPIPVSDFHEYINGVTSGSIKRSETVIIKFAAKETINNLKGTELSVGTLIFKPKIEGKAVWVDNTTLEFKPEKMLEWDTKYQGKLKLSKLFETEKDLSEFEFSFSTSPKQFVVNHSGLSISAETNGSYELPGNIKTSDEFDPNEIESMFNAQQGNTQLQVSWDHQPKLNQHNYTILNIKRKDNDSEIIIQWQGEKIGSKNANGEILVKVPSIKNFNVSTARVVNQPDQYVEIFFSDPIRNDEDLRGLIQIDNLNASKISIDYNVLKIFPPTRINGMHTVTLNAAIQSKMGYRLQEDCVYNLNFGGIKPQVRPLGNGTIVPQSSGLFFPFEAAGLNAVDVRITKIFSNNIHSFFQDNDYDNSYRISRVGRIIHRSKVDLTSKGANDLTTWNAFNLELGKLIDIEAGAIYNVEIGFRPQYSLFNCNSLDEEHDQYIPIEEEHLYPHRSYQSVYYDYYYNWRERDEPCKQAYFSPDKFINSNILGSNFGIIAKTNQANKTYVFVTNLLTAEPEASVQVELYDYQNQLLASGTTNSEGMIQIDAERNPFLVVAQKDKQVGYLKIDGSTIQQTSNFDVSGVSVKKGIKGFIYGERDVWRPGDSIFVNFILEDKQNQLPNGHPIIMELYNPHGQLIQKLVTNRDKRYIYPFYFKTNTEDITGNWQAIIKIGAAKFTKNIRVETVKPNRLKINLDFGDKPLNAFRTTVGKLESKWLHGAPAKNLKAKIDVNFTAYAPTFKNYRNFDFSTPYNSFYGQEITIFNDKTNEGGNADVRFNFKPNNEISGFLKASFTTKVFENGGDFSINQFSKAYSPYLDYVGVDIDWSYKNWNKLNNDESHSIEVATVNENGEPVDLSGIEVKLFELDYRWWYNSGYENLASYSGKTYHRPVLKRLINSQNGKASFTINKNEERWGRHLLLVKSPNGHVCGQIIYFGWAWGRQKNQKDAQMLALVTEKDEFKVGEGVTISFPANNEAKALITYENGNGIIGQEWIDHLSDFTHHTFTATPEMAPNIYVHVTLIQPHGQTANDLPIRLYGVVPIMVEDPVTKLQPQLKMPDEIRPLKQFEIEVSEQNKQAMDYNIAIVDEGLLDLTNFKTPNPWKSFFAKEALGIKTYDMYNYVMGAFGSRLESMYAVGGSDALNDNGKKKAERFKPVVKVIGPFHLNEKEKATHTVTLPQYVGSVRTMIIAANNGKYGHTDKAVAVREPLMVLATMPRVLSPNETVNLPVSVFAMKENIKKVRIKATTNQLLSPIGTTDTTITFDEIGEKDIFLKVKSAEKTGVANVRIEVSSGKEKAFHEIELDIRYPNLPSSETEFKLLKAGESWENTLDEIGMEGSNSAEIEISSMPSLNLGRRLKYLLSYPHGCIEQTTSAAFPQLYLPKLVNLTNKQLDKTNHHIEEAIGKIQRFQKGDGNFSYWPGGSYGNDWATCYAGHFLIEAEKAGYLVPGNMKNNWLNYTRNKAAQFKSRDDYRYLNYQQAYRLYVLALAGEPQISAMNRLRSHAQLSNQTKWLLAGAYALSGMKNAAYDLIDFRNMVPEKPYHYCYSSYLRDESIFLLTLTALNETEKATSLALKISKSLSTASWYSTQTTAFSMVALANFGKQTGANNKMNYNLSINNKASGSNGESQIELKAIEFEKNQALINIENKGESSLFINLTNRGIKPGIDKTTKEQGVQMVVKYIDKGQHKVDPTAIKQGTDFIAQVTLYNKTPYAVKDIALSQQFPAGWEIINSRLFGNSTFKNSKFDYQDIRDDRVYTYLELGALETKTFYINLNASYAGEYNLSPVIVEAMYDNSFSAQVAGMKVEVVK